MKVEGPGSRGLQGLRVPPLLYFRTNASEHGGPKGLCGAERAGLELAGHTESAVWEVIVSVPTVR